MDPHATGVHLQKEGLRERNTHADGQETGRDAVPPVEVDSQEKNKKTFGRTPDGTSEL
jgi:hypothetical protein